MRQMLLAAACLGILSSAGSGEQLVNGPVIVFLGAPGSGKTTQAAAAAKYLNVPVVAVSDLIRENANELKQMQTPGISGMEPETDPALNRFFQARLSKGDLSKGMILDGYPNTNDHANFAAGLVKAGVIPKPIILHLRIPDDVVRKRMAGKDGKLPASVEQRLKDYHRETIALKIYFPDADITDIDGTKKPRTVTRQVQAVLKSKFKK